MKNIKYGQLYINKLEFHYLSFPKPPRLAASSGDTSKKQTKSGFGKPLSGCLHHSKDMFSLADENAIPEKEYRSTITLCPCSSAFVNSDTFSHRLVENSR